MAVRRGKQGHLRTGLLLAYIGDLLGDVGQAADTPDPTKRYVYARIPKTLERIRDEVFDLFGNPCERCDGHGTITWGSSEKRCNVCEGTGRGSATTRLAVQVADAVEQKARVDRAIELGKQLARERHM